MTTSRSRYSAWSSQPASSSRKKIVTGGGSAARARRRGSSQVLINHRVAPCGGDAAGDVCFQQPRRPICPVDVQRERARTERERVFDRGGHGVQTVSRQHPKHAKRLEAPRALHLLGLAALREG